MKIFIEKILKISLKKLFKNYLNFIRKSIYWHSVLQNRLVKHYECGKEGAAANEIPAPKIMILIFLVLDALIAQNRYSG